MYYIEIGSVVVGLWHTSPGVTSTLSDALTALILSSVKCSRNLVVQTLLNYHDKFENRSSYQFNKLLLNACYLPNFLLVCWNYLLFDL